VTRKQAACARFCLWSAAARRRFLLPFAFLFLPGILLSAGVGAAPVFAQQVVIDKIEFSGNRRFQRDMLRARIFTRAGDVYNEEALRRDFQAL